MTYITADNGEMDRIAGMNAADIVSSVLSDVRLSPEGSRILASTVDYLTTPTVHRLEHERFGSTVWEFLYAGDVSGVTAMAVNAGGLL